MMYDQADKARLAFVKKEKTENESNEGGNAF